MIEGCGQQNGMKLSSLTSHVSVRNTTMVGFGSGDTVERGSLIDHHTGTEPGIMVWGGIGYHSRTPLVRIAGTLNSRGVEASYPSLPSGLGHSHISTG
ncbi:transposable element Tcb1 transposase [Trichonephila clavipes]|nr:transposable element Tcb1 transposase [Trichonephila clavipes]